MTLSPHKLFKQRKGPLLLIIMDGIGIGEQNDANAVYLAKTPILDGLISKPLYRQLAAHGRAVGMPSDEDMGNSEVGHNTLGSGRIVDQGASLVNQAIETGTLFEGKTWKNILLNCKQNQSTLHFIGLLSDGNVHSHIKHLKAMIQAGVKEGIHRIRIHALLDGRDVGEKTAIHYIRDLDSFLFQVNQEGADCKIASGGGRMNVTMDRYNADWRIVERGWKAHVLGNARQFSSAEEAVTTFYNEDTTITDQYLPPFVIAENHEPVGRIQNGDSVICFNFRGDRVIELSRAFEDENFSFFERGIGPKVLYAGLMQYDGDLKLPQNFLVDPPNIDKPLGYYLCKMNCRTFAISETQKYGHVTYFWNGNKSGYIEPTLEQYIEIESDRIPFDQAPKMKADEISTQAIKLLESGRFDFGRINFPNGDMVGHTGNLEATITSVEETDRCVGRLIEVVHQLGGITVILADHGNADEMFTIKNGVKSPKTAHTLNPVPFAIVDSMTSEYHLRSDLPHAGLANVAATLCNLLGYEAPSDYEPSLLNFYEDVR